MKAVEFNCRGCGRDIISFEPGFEHYADARAKLCGHCKILGPHRSRAFQDWQDGNISEEEFKILYEGRGIT